MAASDPTIPQTLNRYGYVGNNPVNQIDPSGLLSFLCEYDSGDCGGSSFGASGCDFLLDGCPDDGEGDPGCDPSEVDLCFPMGGGPVILSGDDGGGAIAPSQQRQSKRTGGATPTTETLGLPGGLHLHPLGLGDLFGLTPGCEFGVCTSIGDNIVGVAAAGAGTLICQIAEPCGGIEDTGLAAALLLLAITHHFAKKADIRFARDVAKAVEEICGPGRITSDQIHDLLHWGHYGSFNEAVQDIAAIACPEKVGKTH